MGRDGRTLGTGLVRWFLVGLGLAGLVPTGHAAALAPLFDSPHFPLPIPTADFVIADVNSDGQDDVVGILPGTTTLGVYVNRGRRNFEPLAPVEVGDGPEHLARVELDGDGRPDLVVSGAFGVKTLLGDDGGRFRAGTTLVEGPARFGTGDLNGDGLTDVVVQQGWQSRVFVSLLGGGFQAPAELSSGEGIPLLADFDGDGAVDVAVVRTGDWTQQRVVLYRGDGAGAFGAPYTTFFSDDGNVSDAVVCHATPDALADIAIRIDSYIDHVAILESQSDGSFAHIWPECAPEAAALQGRPENLSENAGPGLEPNEHPKGITCIGAADVDGDGRIELLSTYVYTRASVYTRITFSDGRCLRIPQTASDRVAVGDLDADGRLDVIGGQVDGLVVHPGNGGARYGRGVRSEIAHWSRGGVLADVNGDGILDLASLFMNNNVRVSLGRPDGTFGPPDSDFAQEILTDGRFAMADFDGDGRSDLVTDRGGIWLGNEDGTFQEAGGIAEEASDVAAADLNADGRPDIVFVGPVTSAYLGNGHGSFEPSWSTSIDPGSCIIADGDADGRPDLFVGTAFARGHGDGTFEEPTTTGATGASPVSQVGDLSGDRIPDLVTVDGQVLRGDGSGNWSAWTSIATMPYGFWGKPPLALGDFDGDGDVDVAAADPTFSASIAIYLNDSRGGFIAGGSYGAGLWGNYLQYLMAVDATGDGKLDLMAVYAGDSRGLPGTVTTLVNVYNRAPDVSAAAGRLQSLPSPGRDFARVLVDGIVDPEGDAFTVEVTRVEQDEPVLGSGSGNTCPDARLFHGRAVVRLERSGQGDGRIYEIHFVARDALGNESEGQAQVCVPHDQSGEPCIDSGRRYPSFACRGEQVAETEDATADLRVRSVAAGGVRFGVTMPGAGAGDVMVFDVAGRRLTKLEFACEGPCERELAWNRGGSAPGVYFARMRTAWGTQSRTVVLTRR